MIKGIYRITSSGSLVAEYENMITSNGLVAINQYLAGSIPDWAGSLAIGTLSTNATTTNTISLDYEILRYPITLKTYRTVSGSNQIAMKAIVDPSTAFQAYEFGIFPIRVSSLTFKDNFKITDFSETSSGSSSWYIGGTPATTASARSGEAGISISANQTASIVTYSGLGQYTDADSLDLLYYCSSAIPSTASITVYIADDSSSVNVWTASATIGATASGTYSHIVLPFQSKPTSFTNTSYSCSISFAGAGGTLRLDHLKIVTGETRSATEKIVSRTTSSSPLVTKSFGQPLEIEYYVQVT